MGFAGICVRGVEVMPCLLFVVKPFSEQLIIKRGCFTIAKKEQLINEEIREKEVRVVGAQGEQLGIMSSARALDIAMEKNLDLVLIAPQGVPPVCRIMDFGKHKFEQAKRDKEARKNQKIVETKEIRLSLKIDRHDLETKLKHAASFLGAGDKVKVSIRFRGREVAHANQGTALMEKVAEALGELGKIDKLPKMEGRSMVMFITPLKPVK